MSFLVFKGGKSSMTIEQIKKWYETYRKGTYVVVKKETTKNGYTKQTRMVVRFVNYYNIASVKAKGTSEGKARVYEISIIPHVLKTNLNTQNDLLMCYTTNHHKAHNVYLHEGKPITKEQYYEGINEKEKNYPFSVVYSMKANEIVSIGA